LQSGSASAASVWHPKPETGSGIIILGQWGFKAGYDEILRIQWGPTIMRYYIESDGRVFLVNRGEIRDLPSPAEVPFVVERIAPLPTAEPAWFCIPRLDGHPREWPSKDDLPAADNVTPLVRDAVHATMPRVVVEGVCLRDGQVLLVRGNRGLTKDRWTLPGGFLRFGESPHDGVLRELREEIGVDATVEELIGVHSKLGRHKRLHWCMVFFRVRIKGEPVPNPDEIAQARFVDLDEARTLVSDELMCNAIETMAELARSAGTPSNP
jgi:8-oxo-dGTP diphosphatase